MSANLPAEKKTLKPAVRLKYEHLASIVLAHPNRPMDWYAAKAGMKLDAFKRIYAKEDFADVLIKRRDALLGPMIAEAQLANSRLHGEAINKVIDKIEEIEPRLLIEAINVTGKNMGLQRPSAPNVAVNTQFVVKWQDDEDRTIQHVPPAS